MAMVSIYVQHLGGYGVPQDILEARTRLMIEAGFLLLKSDPIPDPHDGGKLKHWAVWYLPGDWAAKGPITGKTVDQIREWVSLRIQPGEIEIAREHWGLSID